MKNFKKKEVKNKKTGMIMVQGTSSNVGKSILVTALCRIFSQDNYRTVPFKSWNMSLNSTVTPEGGEIGIAQAIQARAAGISPTVNMQPLLLKPSDQEIQVVAGGRPLDRDNLKQGQEYTKWALSLIEKSLDNLKEKADIIVMEGAGSPAEVNVKARDLANMKAALLNRTPVILVADVDRGGALASLVGTVRLLEPEERELIAGFILNKFRGDYELLKPALDFLEEYTGKPVLGVIPYLRDVKLPEEDSVSLGRGQQPDGEAKVKIAVINFPHLSNFTDFDSLVLEPNVKVDYINNSGQLAGFDLIILPGTKSTIADLTYLKERGLAREIKKIVTAGTPLIGICGGFQMLGKTILDPDQIEANRKEIEGLKLLPMETIFTAGKSTHQVKARISGRADENDFFAGLEGEVVSGYEIHMGETSFLDDIISPLTVFEKSGHSVNYFDGALDNEGLVFGTYLHGIFNNDNFRRRVINSLRLRRGLEPVDGAGYSYQEQFAANLDQLARVVRKNLKMDLIYDLTFVENSGRM